MDSDDDLAVVSAIVALQSQSSTKCRRRRRCWARPWLLRRPQYGAYETLLSELGQEDSRGLHNCLHMEALQFEELSRMVGPSIERSNTNMRLCISARERLAITLRFVASGKHNYNKL